MGRPFVRNQCMNNSTTGAAISPKHRFSPLSIAISLAMLGGASQALADKSPADREFDNRFYIGGNVGVTSIDPRTSNTPFRVSDDSSTGGSLYLGYDISKRLSIEGYVAKLGDAEIVRTSDGTRQGGIEYDGYGISAIGYLYNFRNASDYSNGFDDEGYFRREGLSLFGRVGLGSLDTSSSAVAFEQLEDLQLHLGAGLEYGWANGFAARAEVISYDEDAKLIAVGILKRFGDAKPYPVAKPPVVATPVAPKLKPPVSPPVKSAPPQEMIPSVELPIVHFEFDRSQLTGVAKAILDSFVADILQPSPELRVGIFGHTDSDGSDAYNMPLSIRRADVVRRYLESKGIEGGRLESSGLGEGSPVTQNITSEDKANNRRVEFEILK